MAISLEQRVATVKAAARHGKDTGSPEVQISLLTEEINALSNHLQDHDKDNTSRRGLIKKVGTRNRLLTYLSRENPSSYQALIQRLGLRK